MNFKLQTTDMVQEADKAQKGWNLVLEILLFLGFFLISQVALGLLVGIPTGIYVFILGMADAGAGLTANAADLEARLMQVSMTISLYAELAGIFLILGLCKGIQKRKAWTLGFKKRNMGKEYAIGMGIGFLMMTLAVLISWITGALEIHGNPDAANVKSILMLILIFVGFLFQGMFEEVLCRGYFLTSIARRKGNMWLGIVVSSLSFAALHLGNDGISPMAFLNLTLFGIFAGIYYTKRGDLWGIGAIHSLWNFTQGNIWGVLVSGIDFGPSLFRSQITEGMELLNGGSFGLEGGLIVTVILIVSSLLALRLPQKEAALPQNTAVSE